jgi:hypothetical protein
MMRVSHEAPLRKSAGCPDKIMAEFTAGLLQHYGINALPLTSALDAIEHVENLYFDVALVSDWMPAALPQLLFEVNRANWLEVLILHSEPLDDDPKFVLAVSEAVNERCWMCFLIDDAWHSGWYGEAGQDVYQKSELTETARGVEETACIGKA